MSHPLRGPAPDLPPPRHKDPEEDRECSFCGVAVASDGPYFECPACPAVYHPECWRFAGTRCSRFGCPGVWMAAVAPEREHPKPRASRPPSAIPPRPRLRAAPSRALSGVWRLPYGAPIFAAVVGTLLCLMLRGAHLSVAAAVGPEAVHGPWLRPLLTTLGPGWLPLWMLAGLVYGLAHRRYLQGRYGRPYEVLRLLASLFYLLPASYLLAYLLMVPAYRWGAWPWGVLGQLQWISPWLAGAGAVVGLLAALDNFSKRFSFLDVALAQLFVLAILGAFAYLLATALGLIFGGVLWAVGGLVETVGGWFGARWTLSGPWADIGKLIGAGLGFASAFLSPFTYKKQTAGREP